LTGGAYGAFLTQTEDGHGGFDSKIGYGNSLGLGPVSVGVQATVDLNHIHNSGVSASAALLGVYGDVAENARGEASGGFGVGLPFWARATARLSRRWVTAGALMVTAMSQPMVSTRRLATNRIRKRQPRKLTRTRY